MKIVIKHFLLKTLYFSIYNQWEPHKHNPSVTREHHNSVNWLPWLLSIIKARLVAQLCEQHLPLGGGGLLFCKVLKQLVPFFTPATLHLVESVPQVDRRGMQSTGATDNDWTHPTTTISHIITSPIKQKHTGLIYRNSLPHIQMLLHIVTKKEQVTPKCVRTDQTPISTQDNHHDAQINKHTGNSMNNQL